MGKVVIGIGAPHTPDFPAVAKERGRELRVTVLFERLREELEAARPDLVVVFTSDHFVGFFFDNMPTFCVGTFEDAEGPQELSKTMPDYRVVGHPDFAEGLLKFGMESGFDLASSEEQKLDHSLLVPMHFLTPGMPLPIVPINIKGLAAPMPNAHRCYALGQMVRRFIDQRPADERVAIVGSGSFSLEVGGPTMGRIDQDWVDFVVGHMREGKVADLVENATAERMGNAGNTGGELLNWIALLGVVGERPADFLAPDAQPPEQPRDSHAYAFWKGEA